MAVAPGAEGLVLTRFDKASLRYSHEGIACARFPAG